MNYKISVELDTLFSHLGLDLAEFIDEPLSKLIRHLLVSCYEGGESITDFDNHNEILIEIHDVPRFIKFLELNGVSRFPDDFEGTDWEFADRVLELMRKYMKEGDE